MRRLGCPVICTVLALLVPQHSLPASSLQWLGDLPGGETRSSAHGVSADGTTVVGDSSTAEGTEAFRWTESTGIVGLSDLPGGSIYSDAYGVSADGSVITGSSGSDDYVVEIFRWTESGGMVGLGDLPGGNEFGNGRGISADGSVIVGAGETDTGTVLPTWAVRWTQATGLVTLEQPPTHAYSYAWALSADGSVAAGEASSDEEMVAFRWTAQGGIVDLGLLPGGISSSGRGLSSDGSTVVGWGDTEVGGENLPMAFRWTSATQMVGLGFLPDGSASEAYDASADGSVIVGSADNGGDTAFIWDSVNGMRDLRQVLETEYGLDLADWQLTVATSISDDGRTIVGNGVGPLGNSEAWIAVLEEPAADPLLSVAHGPGPGEVVLTWVGGQPDFAVYRSEDAETITEPWNQLGTTTDRVWVDDPPAGALFCYRVTGS